MMKKQRFYLITAFLLATGVLLLPRPVETTGTYGSLFRSSGDGVLPLYNRATKEFEEILYRDADGNYSDVALARIDELLACHYDQQHITMSLKLIELIDHLQDHFQAPEIEIFSGYRSPNYNAKLRRSTSRAASQSMHVLGRAVDLRLKGVPSVKIRKYASSLRAGGVGYYGRLQPVHIDTGPVRTWYR